MDNLLPILALITALVFLALMGVVTFITVSIIRKNWPQLGWYHDGVLKTRYVRPGSRVRIPNTKKGFNRYVFFNFSPCTYKFVGTWQSPTGVADAMGDLRLEFGAEHEISVADGRFVKYDE